MNEKPAENKVENWHRISEVMTSRNKKILFDFKNSSGNVICGELETAEARRLFLHLKSALAEQPTEPGGRTEAE